MKKSSLGRRNSNRQSFALGRPSADVSAVRKSGIPVAQNARSKSSERPTVSGSQNSMAKSSERPTTASNFFSRLNHAGSANNLHVFDLVTPAKTPLSSRFIPGHGERPSRATSYGTSSVGTSSYGGHKSKRDNRPLQEKEWQLQAYTFIENIINQDPSGPEVLGPGLKPLSLNKFVDACDLLLKMLDRSVCITKHNYIKELPFLLGKKMQYKGKMEKSWMIAVNTQHAIPYALGLLHFLSQCANILINVDITSWMFPCEIDNNQMSEMNFQLLIPYYNQSYELRNSNHPNYETYQEELNQMVMQQHYDQDDSLSKRESIMEETDRLQGQKQKMMHEHDLAQQEYEAVEREYNNSLQTIKEKEEELVKNRIMINSCKSELSDSERAMSSIDSELDLLKAEHTKLLKKASEQAINHRDIENVKKRRDSLEREITSNQKYIQSYQDMIYTEDLEIVKLKTEIEELTRESNLRVMKYVPVEQKLGKMILPTRMEDLDLSVIDVLKNEIEKLKTDCMARSQDFITDKTAAECERDQAMRALIELESSNAAKLVNIESLKSECDILLEALNKERNSLGDEFQKMKSEIEKLEKQASDLQVESETKQELVSRRRKENEACEKIMEETVNRLKNKALAVKAQIKTIKSQRTK